MATLFNQGHQNFKWRKQLRSRCLIEAQQISFISATVAETRHHPIVLFPSRIDRVVQINRKYGDESLATRRDTQRIRLRLVVSCLFQLENQEETKHVESSLVPRLDEGSSPSSSTTHTDCQALAKVWGKKWGKNSRKMPFGVSSFVYTTIGPFHNEPMTE